MSQDLEAVRSSTSSSTRPEPVEREQGPAAQLGLEPFAALRARVRELEAVLAGVECERHEICVRSCGRHLPGAEPSRRVALSVQLVVRGPRTRSPVLWQGGGANLDAEDWAAELAAGLPAELEAIATGEALAEPWTGTVVLEPWLSALLIHECIGHTSEADNYLDYVAPSGLGLGHRWTEAPLSVIDDPGLVGHIGAYIRDDEGEAGAPTTILDRGRWRALLHDRRTAAALDAPRSGNGRRVVGAETAIPRMSVLMAMPGAHTPEQLIAGVEEGWYCRGSWGGGSIGRRFILRPTYALRIRAGRISGQCLRRFDLRGDKFSTIAAIDAIADDTRCFDPAFGCDKDGQDGLPVSFGAPHLRLRNITLSPIPLPHVD